MADRRARFKAAEVHINDGLKLRNQQKLDEALVEFQKAYVLDPSYAVALQEIRNTEQMIRREPPRTASAVLSPVQKAEQAINARVKSLEGPPELRPLNNQITNLRMNNQTMRVLYETVAKLAGINVLFDRGRRRAGQGGTAKLQSRSEPGDAIGGARLYRAARRTPSGNRFRSNAIFVAARQRAETAGISGSGCKGLLYSKCRARKQSSRICSTPFARAPI